MIKNIAMLLINPLVMIGILVLAALTFRASGKVKAAKISVGVALGLLLTTSQYSVSNWLLTPLEAFSEAQPRQYRSYQFIVPLACYYNSQSSHIEISRWSDCSLQRLVQAAIELKSHGTASTKIVLTGGNFMRDKNVYYADKASFFLQSIGVDPAQIVTINKGTNTREEVQHLLNKVGNQPTLIISSATHLYRVSNLTQHTSTIDLLAVDYKSASNDNTLLNWPSANAMQNCQDALYEYLAILRDALFYE